jgi:hypothetical protein
MKLLRYLYRSFRWWLKCLWAGKVEPRKEVKLFSRTLMRKAWRYSLRDIDRRFNYTRDRTLLMARRIMVAKRRAFRFE